MEKIPFSEDELTVVKEVKSALRGSVRTYNTPITNRENFRHCFTDKCPLWILPARGTSADITPKCIPDNVARGFVHSAEGFDNAANGGGPDMFGIEWVYVPQVGGSMVKPGNPTLEDANDWKDVLKEPDIDSWDWEGSAKANADYINGDAWATFTILNGAWMERLISFMDFEGAAMALIDEDQQDAVKEIFEMTTNTLMKIVDKVAEYFPRIDAIMVHDDWGSQKDPFFSEETAYEMIVPYMKKLTDYIKSKGFVAMLHSCGHNEKRVQCYIDAGWQSWTPQPMNDTKKLYDEYGDKILISVIETLPEGMSEEDQIKAADEYVEKYFAPGKPSLISYDTKNVAFERELYKASRLKMLNA